MPYTSDIPFEPHRVHAAAVYCSDGRFGDQCDQFLHHHLGLPNYDRIALPGGPAALAGHVEATIDRQAILDDLRFLIDAHRLRRVVLIAHEGCAFYAQRLGLSPEAARRAQHDDLHCVATMLRAIAPLERVETYLACVAGERVRFEPTNVAQIDERRGPG